MINDIAATVLVKTLLHSLWQGAIILLLVLCVNYFLHNKAKIKYWTSIVALYLLLIINLATFYFLSFTPAASAELYSTANYNFIIQLIYKTDASTVNLANESIFFKLMIIWWSGMAALLIYRLVGIFYLRKLNKDAMGLPKADKINSLLHDKMAQLGMHNRVKIKTSDKIQSPFTFGVWKPIIMMPVAMLEWMNTEQLEIIILHELIHIRRYDYLINLINTFIEIIYFFNPAVWILRKIIEQEREYSCDYEVNRLIKNPIQYSKTLSQINYNNVNSVISLNQKKNLLMKRIQEILGRRRPEVPVMPIMLIILLLVVSLSGYKSIASSRSINLIESLNLENFLNMDDTQQKNILPEKPKPVKRRPSSNLKMLNSIKPMLKITNDDTAKSTDFKIRVDKGFTISSHKDKAYYLNGEEINKNSLNDLDPDDIKSITIKEDDIMIFTKDFEELSEAEKNKEMNTLSIRKKTDKEITPLYILDGEKVSNEALNTIVPDDIKSISVLRDEKAIEVYGDEGKNGVIIIKLKK